ncbi:MAG: FG-GAP repeat domain-containing protein, partial [Rhizomicrobium sp.]
MLRFAIQSCAVVLVAAATVGASAQEFQPLAPKTCKLKFKSTNYTTGTDPQSIVVGDFNKDGKLDFAQVNYSNGGAGSVGVFLGNGDGRFQLKGTYATGAGPDALAMADVNADGNLDLVVGNDTGASVSV